MEGPERAEGYHCPRCGGPVFWLYNRRFDPLPGQATYARASVEYRDAERRTRADREEVVVDGRRGNEAHTRKVYVRRLELVCPRCNVITSRAQAGKGDPTPGAGRDVRLPLGSGRED